MLASGRIDFTFCSKWLQHLCSLHVSASHSWNSFDISKLFIIIIFLWWSVISDLWCSFIIWGLHKPHPISVLSHFSCVHLFATPCIVAHQAPLSMGFSMPEYWSGLSFPSTGHLPNPGIESSSLIFPALAERFFTTSTTWEVPYKAVKSIDKCSDYSTPRLLPTSLFL